MTNRLTRRTVLAAILAAAATALAPAAFAKEASKQDKQAEVRKVAQETLDRLYTLQPGARTAIQNAAGYAVFSNFGMKIFVAGGGTGPGSPSTTRRSPRPSCTWSKSRPGWAWA